MLRIAALLVVSAVPALVFSTALQAQDLFPSGQNDLTVYGGVMTHGDFPGDSLIPFYAELDEVYFIGAAYNRELAQLGYGFSVGAEVGLAGRFGDGQSGEAWFGPSLRYEGVKLGPVTISAGLVGGISVVTDSHGIEGDRERWSGGDASIVYYAGPEIGLNFDALPNVDLIFRTHHRSGGKNVSFLPSLGDMPDASNNNLIGIRYHF